MSLRFPGCFPVAFLLAACAPPAPAAPADPGPPPAIPAPSPVALVAPVASASASAPAEPPPAVVVPAEVHLAPPVVDKGAFTHEITVPIVSIAMGEPRVAALGAEPWILEKGSWTKLPYPDHIRATLREGAEGRIFFGRDDRPRVMGVRQHKGHAAQLYLRQRDGVWADASGEIGKLRDLPAQALFGVLGHADPEVVCKIDDDCIIKRRTGWKMLRAGSIRTRIDLQGGVAWAIYPDSVARLEDDKRWVTVGAPAPFRDPGGLWARGDEVWVSEPVSGRLFHLREGAWASEPAPFASPRGLWGPARDDIWLAGAGGLAHYDGSRWSIVAGPTGPLSEVDGRPGEVWAAGESGVWAHREAGAARR